MSIIGDTAPDEFAKMLQQLCFGNPDPTFWNGLDEQALKDQFEHASADVFHSVSPVWDLRHESLGFNEVVPEALAGAKLYIARRQAFLDHCADGAIYCHAAYERYSSIRQILKVIGQWLRGDSLTPPLFFLDSEKELRKVDGHHRATVALMSHSPFLPFYCQDIVEIQGIELADSEFLTKARWTPK